MSFKHIAKRGYPQTNRRSLASGFAMVAASLLWSPYAYSQGLVTLYQNDFESPNVVAGETYANGFANPPGLTKGGTYEARLLRAFCCRLVIENSQMLHFK